ncbi:hypothetical protein UlMin_031068 [Ulmus minor]
MAENDPSDGDNLTVTEVTSFSQLLFADDEVVGLGVNQSFNYGSSGFCSDKTPKMLCFGGYPREEELVFSETTTNTRFSQKSGVTCSESSSASSTNNLNFNALSKSQKCRNGSSQEPVQSTCTNTTSTTTGQRTHKKIKTENPTSTGPAKRKEKLGERIAGLQQLVSPFGKTDTASVLHEAMGYIRFLHDQVQVLCSPYLQRFPSLPEGGENGEREARRDLRSRGLCLVPVECTVHVANNNGADFWSPAMASNVSSSTKQ